jgi:general secretion pathway protein K
MNRARSGFALMTVLWVMVGVSLVGLAGALAAREDVDAAHNRVDSERATWRAEDCLERARAAADEALANARRDETTLHVWRSLDTHVLSSALARTEGCDIRVEAAGARLDVNAVDAAELRTLFRAMSVPDPDGLTDGLLDWRDPDDEPRLNGAERAWYARQTRIGPRNGPIADVRELARIRGFETLATFDTVIGVEPGRIPINSAPLTVLASVPGFTSGVLARIALEREDRRQISDVLALSAKVSRPAADSIMAHYPEIARLTTVNPDAWILIARGWAGSPEAQAIVDARIVLDDGRAAIVRRRSWQ